MAQVELAGSLIERYRRVGRSEDLDEAIRATGEAVSVFMRDSGEWSFCMQVRAQAFQFRFEERGEQADFSSSTQAYDELLKTLDDETWPERMMAAVTGLAELKTAQGDWKAVAEFWRRAIGVANRLYQSQVYLRGREANLRRSADMPQRAAYAFARAGKLEEAVVAVETGRARALSEGLARDRADLETVRELDREGYDLYVAAAGRLRQIEAAERAHGRDDDATVFLGDAARPNLLREEARNARAQLQAAIARIRNLPGYESFLAEPGWEEIARGLEPDGSSALVYLASSRGGGMALVVRSDR